MFDPYTDDYEWRPFNSEKEMKKDIVIFDLDGTLAIIDERMKLATGGNTHEGDVNKINWKVLHDPANIKLDEPNMPVVTACKLFFDNDYQIYIFSGRDDATEGETRKWLNQHMIPFHKLVMRPNKYSSVHKNRVYMPDDDLKQGMLDEHVDDINRVLMVYDDRNKVVDMWRRNGIVCAQVNYGDF